MRNRDLSRYDEKTSAFANVDAFIASGVTTGLLSIEYNGAPLDFLSVYRGSATTLVSFHASLTPRQRTLPAFSGIDTAAQAGMNLIAIADPSVALGVDLAWYLGNRGQGVVRPAIAKVVRHLLDAFGSGRTILFGASGGGYAAAYYAPEFPGSIALLLNPRLDMTARPLAAVGDYLRVCHGVNSATPARRIRAQFVRERVVDTYGPNLDHYVAILQNAGDPAFMNHQVNPFLAELSDTGRVFVRYGDWGDGHTPVPKEVIQESLLALRDTQIPLSSLLPGELFQYASVATDV